MPNPKRTLSIWELYRQQPRIMLADDHADGDGRNAPLTEFDFMLESADLVRAHGLGVRL